MKRRFLPVTVLLAAALGTGAATGTAAAGADDLQVVTVMPGRDAGARDVVVQVRPSPPGALPTDAAQVEVGGDAVPAATRPLLLPASRTALVVDGSQAGAAVLPQAMSGMAGFLLSLRPDAPVTIVVDGAPPTTLTDGAVAPAAAIHELTTVRSSGDRSTGAALRLALLGLQPGRPGSSLLLLATTGPPPADDADVAAVQAAGAVIAVVTTPALAPAWSQLAQQTGGLAVGAQPDGVSKAFDTVAQALRDRSVVSFVPPSTASSAAVRLRTGGSVVSAQVDLPATVAAPQTSSPPVQSQAAAPAPGPATSGESSSAPRIVLLVLVLLVVLVAALLVLARRRGRTASQSTTEFPADYTPDFPTVTGRLLAQPENPATEPEVTGLVEAEDPAPPGVRMFDVSDPQGPVELDLTPPAMEERRSAS